ncbi:CGNR zinc finger domain-containing protein [Actinomadura hibisca]|uniref:CGNR zinc finger domain-containing protein n=1 Tax=Actinomadura hibisca TaxID=68565 RepID=UPI00082D064C|nr:CGNR zinc finger domain-containing protein [Actinomadura hibisca]
MTDVPPGVPGPAPLLRDFVNTLDVECDADELATPARLAQWLNARELGPADLTATPGDLATALGLREGLRAAMLDHHGPPLPALPPGLDAALARLPLRVALTEDGPALVPVGTGAAAALARLAAAVVAADAEGSWSRLKVCQEDTCRWAFLDTSKNRSRSWCSMRVCGNRTKTRAYRARRKAGTP